MQYTELSGAVPFDYAQEPRSRNLSYKADISTTLNDQSLPAYPHILETSRF